MSEKMREEFESWAISCHMCTYLDGVEYRHQSTEWAWMAWQASRAALVIELPELKSFNASDEPDFAYEVAIDDIKCSLDDAGVGYK